MAAAETPSVVDGTRSAPTALSAEATRRQRGRTAALSVAFCAILLVATGVLGFTTLFSTFAEHDDDGYFLITIKGYLDGATLYDQTSGQYGPFYFEFMAGVFKALGLAVTNDGGRLIALALWMGASLLLAAGTYRLGRSLLLAGVVYVLAFDVLRRAPLEPSHPGHLLMFLTAAMVAAALLVLERRPRVAFTVLGALTAAAALSKVNIGVFAAAALVFAAALASPRLMRSRALAAVVPSAYMLVPVLLINRNVLQDGYRDEALHVLLGAFGVALVAVVTTRRHDPDGGSAWWLAYAAGGALGLSSIVCGIVLVQGTSLSGLAHGVVLDALGQTRVFSGPLALPGNAIALDLIGMVVAAAVAFSLLPKTPPWPMVGSVARVAAGIWIWVSIAGSQPLAIPVALAWVAALPTDREAHTPERRFIRLFVPALAVLQVLHAYPVPGSQIQWAAFLLVAVGAVCVADGLGGLGFSGIKLRRPGARLATAAVLGVVVWASVFVLARPLRLSIDTYRSGVPIHTADASWIRVPPATAATYESVVATLRERCRTFVAMPGLGSLYLMTQDRPPTWINMSGWLFLWGDRLQQRVVDQVKDVDGLCAVRNRALEAVWAQGRPIPDRPLRSFILTRFRPIATFGDFEVMAKKVN